MSASDFLLICESKVNLDETEVDYSRSQRSGMANLLGGTASAGWQQRHERQIRGYLYLVSQTLGGRQGCAASGGHGYSVPDAKLASRCPEE